jgi:hypothetical protein
MTIRQAIETAIKGGYNYEAARDYMAGGPASRALIFMDVEFWRGLGRKLGWCIDPACAECDVDTVQWLFEWHRFIDYLAEEKTIEQFFEEIEK